MQNVKGSETGLDLRVRGVRTGTAIRQKGGKNEYVNSNFINWEPDIFCNILERSSQS